MLSSHAKNLCTPYHCVFQAWLPPFQSGSPCSTQPRCSGVMDFHGTDSGMPARGAYLTMSSWHSLNEGVCHGLIAPSSKVLFSSGITSPMSMPITRPKPRQASQAPSGELNEKLLGSGSVYSMSQSAPCAARYPAPP
ncbi:Uncharacterised protein [Bordetella pertussis]|nr:Uncharacterised protein [Bordetella pertussis]